MLVRPFLSKKTPYTNFSVFQNKQEKLEEQKKQKPQYIYALNKDEKAQLASFDNKKIKPTIVAIYDEAGGVVMCDLTISYLKDKGLNVVYVTPDQGVNHPIFKDLNVINGIYLPGGPNIKSHHLRTQVEGELINVASTYDIPMIGICRGIQTLGYHHELTVDDLPQCLEGHRPHYDSNQLHEELSTNNTAVVEKDSLLYQALEYKFTNGNAKNKPENNWQEFPIKCLHNQYLQHSPTEYHPNIKITARSKTDGAIESLEKKTGKYYTIAYQHHPEDILHNMMEKKKTERQSYYKEIIDEATDSIDQQILDIPNQHLDLELSLFSTVKERHHAMVTALESFPPHKYSKNFCEKVASVELGLFINQTKKHFLENQQPTAQTKTKRLGE